MLIKPSKLKFFWKVKPFSVLHIGAHKAEELHQYKSLGWGSVVWIEAQRELSEELSKLFIGSNQTVIHAAIWDVDNIELKLNVTNNSQSTSLLELGTHKADYPNIKVSKVEIVKTKRIDSIFNEETIPEFVNIDIQGAEFQALKGFGPLLHKVKFIYCEVNKKEVYVNCGSVSEIDRHLSLFGFKRITTRWVPFKGWGDAFYVNLSLNPVSRFMQLIGFFFGIIYPPIYFVTSFLSRVKRLLK